MRINNYANEAETGLKLFQAVSVFCFSFISECATGLVCLSVQQVTYV